MLPFAPAQTTSSQPMHVIVVDRLSLFRCGLAELIRNAMPGCVVQDAADLEAAAALVERFPADVVLADPEAEGGEAVLRLRRLLAARTGLKVAMLTAANDRSAAFTWLQAGAHGCVPKSAGLDELCEALRTIRAGHGYVSSAILAAAPLPPAPAPAPAPAEPASALTARQQDVLRLVAQGRPTKDIARRLGLSVSTVKAHLAAAYRSLGAHNRVEALVRCRDTAQVVVG